MDKNVQEDNLFEIPNLDVPMTKNRKAAVPIGQLQNLEITEK